MASTTSNKNSYESQHHKPKHKHNCVKIQQDKQEFHNIMLQGWIVADVKMGTRLCQKVVEMVTEV
jgi:hypothetical protein